MVLTRQASASTCAGCREGSLPYTFAAFLAVPRSGVDVAVQVDKGVDVSVGVGRRSLQQDGKSGSSGGGNYPSTTVTAPTTTVQDTSQQVCTTV
jgi:hypothetical protein